MKKFMVADLIKDLESDSIKRIMVNWKISEDEAKSVYDLSKGGMPEEIAIEYVQSNNKEYNDGVGMHQEYAGTYYDLEIDYDVKNDNYIISIDWHKGGSSELTVDGSDAENIANNGLDESKRNPPMPWPFGSKDFLHWPNQR